MIRALLLAVFFASGCAALIYQTLWQRLLTLFGGADVYSVTIVVAAFMGGLGFGNLAGGWLADRLPARTRLMAFAACEAAVAIFAVASVPLYYDVLYTRFGDVDLSHAGLAIVVACITLWPTFFMGMSLPLLARPFRADDDAVEEWIASLYGWNTLGAAFGALTSGLLLFRWLDIRQSTMLAAVVSGGCAIVAAVLARRTPHAAQVPSTRTVEEALPSVAATDRLTWWILAYACSGFIALSLEIVWFRVLGTMLKSNAYTFGCLLATFLVGLGAGTLAGRHRVLRRWNAARAFVLSQFAVPILAALSLALLLFVVEHVGPAGPIRRFLASPNPLTPHSFRSIRAVALYVGLAGSLILPATIAMGLSFGFLQRAVQTDGRYIARRVGWLQTANIAGSMAGALATGIWMLSWFGAPRTLQLLVGLSPVALVLGWAIHAIRSKVLLAASLVVAVLTAAALPGPDAFWAKLHGATTANAIVQEDASGVVLLRDEGDGRTRVFLGGFSQSWLPYGGAHTALGALPTLVHPHPERVAVIGLGSGDTLFSIGARPETRTIDNFEIVGTQLAALRQLDRAGRYPALSALLGDPRVTYRVTDARAHLRRVKPRYDIIEADALLPTAAYSGNLYSREYFALLRASLRPGGFAVTWAPTPRIRATVAAVFPYVLLFRDIAIASDQPIPYVRELVEQRLQAPAVAAHFVRGQIDIRRILGAYLDPAPVALTPGAGRESYVDINRDLFPKDEFERPYGTHGEISALNP
ncbi:MAG: fused MFS/spermidine synthase [Vicinamibacterales bacterium]